MSLFNKEIAASRTAALSYFVGQVVRSRTLTLRHVREALLVEFLHQSGILTKAQLEGVSIEQVDIDASNGEGILMLTLGSGSMFQINTLGDVTLLYHNEGSSELPVHKVRAKDIDTFVHGYIRGWARHSKLVLKGEGPLVDHTRALVFKALTGTLDYATTLLGEMDSGAIMDAKEVFLREGHRVVITY